MTLDKFIGYLIEWTKDRGGQLKYNWPVKGGWEGWIQVDLVAHILNINNTHNILRDQPIYQNNLKRVDLLIQDGESSTEAIAVEIKAESLENQKSFIGGVIDDVSKLETERNTNYQNSKALVIAVAFSRESVDALLGIKHPASQTKIFTNICQFQSEVAILIAVKDGSNPWNQA